MKISKKIEPIILGIFGSIIIGVLSFLSFETSTGFWLMFSFGSTTLIVFVFHDSEFAQPTNIFFGHLLAIIIGVIFNEILGISFVSLGLSVGLTITLMMYKSYPSASSCKSINSIICRCFRELYFVPCHSRICIYNYLINSIK